MEYKNLKLSTLNLNKPIESKNVTFIWGNDGWCYIPQLNLRQKFTNTHYYHEDWHGVIALPEYIEQVNWSLYSKEPRVWQENTDVFLENAPNQKKNKTTNRSMTRQRRPQPV